MTLEICIDRIESALAAVSGGADRLEVCCALGLDGLTPSYGLVEQCVKIGLVEVMMMIRPHAGGFCCGEQDISTMLRDIGVAKQLGVTGVVFGGLRGDGRIDPELCRRLIEAARPLSITFHRAFDLTPDPLEALDSLLELGIERVLTSGQAASAMDGIKLIQALVRRAGPALSVVAGGGIRAQDVAGLVRATGVLEIHASASEIITEEDHRKARIVQTTRITRPELVRAIAHALRENQSSDAPMPSSTWKK
jgi:copper homeostasis protein